jgi:hypothetical protein
VLPRRAETQQVHVVVDQAGNDRTAARVDPPRRGPGQGRDRLIASHRDDAAAADGNRLRDRELVVNGDDLGVGQDHVGRGLLTVPGRPQQEDGDDGQAGAVSHRCHHVPAAPSRAADVRQ